MAYCTTDDLLIGDLELGSNVDPAGFVNSAADEMDSKLGYIYVVPVSQQSVPPFIWSKLKILNAKLASARLILAVHVGAEETAMHAYGVGLLQEAKGELECLKNGSEILVGAPAAGQDDTSEGNVPTLLQADRDSGVDTFYDYVNTPAWYPVVPQPFEPRWKPGPRGGAGPIGPTTPTPAEKNPNP